nr:FHIPEP family type III secretion protein [Methylomonas koyamae]
MQGPGFRVGCGLDRGQPKRPGADFGYTVVDPSTVVATHLSHILQTNAHELFGYEEAQQLLDNLAKLAPKLVEDLVPKTLPLGVLVKVLQNLLQERVSIRDMRTIAETLAEYGVKSQDPDILTSQCGPHSAGQLCMKSMGYRWKFL